MTVLANVFGLLPILLDDGVGSDVAKRIAAPMWGGLRIGANPALAPIAKDADERLRRVIASLE